MPNSRQVDRTLLNAVATGSVTYETREGLKGFDNPQQGFHHHISWATGVTAGAVTIEFADDASYAGTWAPSATVTFSGTAPKQDYVYTPGQPRAIRHRISTTVSGGGAPSVTTRLTGSPA